MTKNRKRVIITGANGFVGSNLTKYLSQDPTLEVYAMVRPNAPVNFLKDFQYNEDSEEKLFEIVEGNLLDDDSLVEAFEDKNIVIHLASYVSDWGKKERFWQMNVGGTKNVLQAATKVKASRVLYLSSLTVHGFAGHKYSDEKTPYAKKNYAYGETKKIAEELVLEWIVNNPEANGAIIRPGFIIYGRYDKNSFILALDAIASGKFGFINRGKRLVSYVYVENLCYGIGQLIQAQKISGVYNILDGNMTWKEWVAKWEKVVGRKATKLSVPYAFLVPITAAMVGFYKLLQIKKSPLLNFYRINVMRKDLAFVNTRITTEVGYSPPTELDESLEQTLEYYYETKKEKKK
ncbi:MAG: NAD-dependent epimerase/dehydratase family protein [Candidatus Heimdallarchaeota archaeon]|nr:NAD-dependent epimerase/dehydratase family protein [Candidatus Heimdallarchaeota archaeon]MBY8993106.1 NAD-dependent epimerase/dehydratase family protein [Candidatus Heimdallarchaeota archaeon]